LRPLQRQQGLLGHGHNLAAIRKRLQQGHILHLAGGIDDEEQLLPGSIFALTRNHHQVVEHAALLIGEQGVALLALGQPLDVHGHQGFERRSGAIAAQRHLPHVRNVEQPRALPGMQVLGQNALRILHRHGIAGKRHHARTELKVQGVQGSKNQFGSCGVGHVGSRGG
jgi:hypothetical protein